MVRQAGAPGIELRHLVTLAAVARADSLGDAADSLGYVQSAVSAQLRQLEKIAGARLVDRRRGAAVAGLTEAGRLLLAHSEEILERLGAAQADLAAMEDHTARSLSIGVDQSIARTVLPGILRSWVRRTAGRRRPDT